MVSAQAISLTDALGEIVRVPCAPWNGAKAGRCHDNVNEMIRQYGGDQVFGWALTEFGPLTPTGNYAPPLYRCLVNHVVWRDALGDLWEVSPHVTGEHQEEVTFQDIEFYPDPSAMLDRTTPHDWFRTAIRYVPVREEGTEVAEYLTQAQGAASHGEFVSAVQKAVNAIGAAGYQPAKVVVQNVAGNTTCISIYAAFVQQNCF
jgi:hypothetical protein